jgi:hypothetical protein
MNVVNLKQETDTFEEFWKAYPSPRRTGKVLAKAKWDAIVNGGLSTRTLDKDSGQYVDIELRATPEDIILGITRYASSMRLPDGWNYKDDGKFICQPATFLNQGRWMDWL